MSHLHRLVTAALSALLLVVPVGAAWPDEVTVATDADLIAIYSPHREQRLLRVRFDRAAGKASFATFGPLGVETFAVAPKGAFVVHATAARNDGDDGPNLVMLDQNGHAVGKPLRSPIGEVATLAVSPKGDLVAAASARGWLALFAVERAGLARRLVTRAIFGVSPERPFTYAFRPEGGIVTLTNDWVLTHRANDGSVQRSLDLKIANRDLVAESPNSNELLKLTLSPRGDRLAIRWGGGPFATMLFDRNGRLLPLRGAAEQRQILASEVEFLGNGDAMIAYGMAAPVLVRMGPLTSRPFGDPNALASHVVSLAGGRTVAILDDRTVALWSDDSKRLVAPAGLENYEFGLAAAGAADEIIVAAERSGWVDLYTREGKFVRRVQSGARGRSGQAALSADGSVIAAYGSAELGVFAPTGTRLWGATHSSMGLQEYFVAVAANGSRIAAAGPDNMLRSWSRDGADAVGFTLDVAGQVPGQLRGIAVSTGGDAIALPDEKSAVWIAYPADRRVIRVAVAAEAHRIVALPNDAGFAIGLADGTVVRIGRDGSFLGAPFKGSEQGAAGRIVVAPDGQSVIVIDGDEISARHLTLEGKELTRPVRVSRFQQIKAALFQNGAPMLITIVRDRGSGKRDFIQRVSFTDPAVSQSSVFDRPER